MNNRLRGITDVCMPYWQLCELLLDDEARSAGVTDDHTDVRLAVFLQHVWDATPMRRWLQSQACMADEVCLTHWLRLVGWAQQHDLLRDSITKRKLATILCTRLNHEFQVAENTLRNYFQCGGNKMSRYRDDILINMIQNR